MKVLDVSKGINVNSCYECPNIEERHVSIDKTNFICRANGKIVGNSKYMGSIMKVTNEIDERCPFIENRKLLVR